MSAKKFLRFMLWLGVVLLQLIMTQFVTFVFSMPFPNGMQGYPQDHPFIFVLVLVVAYTTGVFYTGWVAIRRRWTTLSPKLRLRLISTLAGALAPLLVALILYHPLEAGNPFFLIATLTSVAGFYLPGWIELG